MSDEELEGKTPEQALGIQTAYGMALAQMGAGLRTRTECIEDLHQGAARASEAAGYMLAAARMLMADREADFEHAVCVPLDFGALRKAATDVSEKTVRRKRPLRP